MTYDATSAKTRYQAIIDVCRQLQPTAVIEIGVHRGARTRHFLDILAHHPYTSSTTYEGYDAFDGLEDHDEVYNGKGPASLKAVELVLKSQPSVYSTLHKGMTSNTLWNNPNSADFVFIDGDHRTDAIRKDFGSVSHGSKMICFDDVVENGPQGAGALPIIQELEQDPAWCVERLKTRVSFKPYGECGIAFVWPSAITMPAAVTNTISVWQQRLT